jgi:hypothetical protein
MRIRLSLWALLGVGLLAWPALAQSSDKPSDDKAADSKTADSAAMKQKLLDNFDTNKDGTIDHREARAIGRALREHFDVGPPGPGDRGPGPRDRGPEGRRRPDGPPRDGRGPEGRGPEGRRPGPPDGRPGPPNPERLFNRFDENEDGSLSLDEFKELSGFMRERMAMRGPGRGPGGPGGPEFGRRGQGGPPPRGGDFDRPRGEGRRWREWREGPPGPPPGPDGPPPPADAPKGEHEHGADEPI